LLIFISVGWGAIALDGFPGLGRMAFDARKPNIIKLDYEYFCWVALSLNPTYITTLLSYIIMSETVK
jgi:hypothetical protein